MDHTNDNEDFPLDLAQDLLEEDAIPDLGERLDLRTARPQFMSRLNFSLAVQDILSSLRNQCAEHATRLNVKPQTLFHSVLNITEKEKKNRKSTAWQAMVHVTWEDLKRSATSTASSLAGHDLDTNIPTPPRESFVNAILEAKKRKQQGYWTEDYIEKVRQDLESRRAGRKTTSTTAPPRTTDARRCLLLMPVDADHPFVPQYIVQSPYLGAVLWKRWGLGGGDMAGTYGVLSGIQAAIQEARARRRLTEEVKEQLNAMLPPSAKVTQVPWANMPLVCLRHSLWWEGIDANFRWEGVRLTSKQEIETLGAAYVKGKLRLRRLENYSEQQQTNMRALLTQLVLQGCSEKAKKREWGDSPPNFSQTELNRLIILVPGAADLQ
ncbi:hypothetical protein FFLO_07177 [Filobasidium floriforme]|uniref:Uncharacterized protein n=1 Tax=Filobasidium floriforme TaxID=5210 RepID=A0A8K0NLE8_9TREE|nr:hypothetical protein FFLO_07177 [Filobasidium floriforme]